MAALVFAEKRTAASPVAAKINPVYSRTIAIKLPASTTAATHTIPGLAFAPGTQLLALHAKPILDSTGVVTTLGTTTFALDTVTVAQNVLVAVAVAAEKVLAPVAASCLLCKSDATANETMTITTVNTTPAAAMTLELTLILASVGAPVGRSTASGN